MVGVNVKFGKEVQELLRRHGILIVMILGLVTSLTFNILQLGEQPISVEVAVDTLVVERHVVVKQGNYVGPAPAIVSFEWGTVLGGPYPYETPPILMNASGPFAFNLTGLSPGITYYNRGKVVVTHYGAEESFTTLLEGVDVNDSY